MSRIYLFLKSRNPADKRKRDKAKEVLGRGNNIVISTQVINEISNVFIKKNIIRNRQQYKNSSQNCWISQKCTY